MELATISEHIAISPGVCGGRPHIAGRRIRVQDVVIWHERFALSPDEIVSLHPQIALSDVYAALAYYHDHRDEIAENLATDESLAEAMQLATPSRLIQKLSRPND
ncbi:MAG: DUF433 domain-containing protein [Candidatus Hydrogenedentes bacterium]|nr:DUF433 domain-containing protein [Candidatus Hydrogenedentota bacterium]